MKKTASVLIWILFFLILLPPAATIIFSILGFNFEFKPNTILAIIIGSLSVFLTILILSNKRLKENKTIRILVTILCPLSLINIAMHVIVLKNLNLTTAIFLFISTICICFLTILCVNSPSLKITSMLLSALVIIPITFLSFVSIIFDDFGEKTVINRLESPNGAYCAEVISDDQGALGGNTIVKIQYGREINTFLFKISKKPQEVYFGEWYEFEDIEVHWKGNSTLIINSKEYNIE